MYDPAKPAPTSLASKLNSHRIARSMVDDDKAGKWPNFVSDYHRLSDPSGVVYITRTEITDQRASGAMPFWVPNIISPHR